MTYQVISELQPILNHYKICCKKVIVCVNPKGLSWNFGQPPNSRRIRVEMVRAPCQTEGCKTRYLAVYLGHLLWYHLDRTPLSTKLDDFGSGQDDAAPCNWLQCSGVGQREALGNAKRWAKLGRSTPPEDVPTLEHWNEVWVNLGTINLTNTKLNINTNYLPLNQIFKTGPV